MKYTIYLLLTSLLLASCGESKPNSTKKDESNKDRIEETSIDTIPEEIDQIWDYYGGAIGLYGEDVVVEISVNRGEISGGYWYLKHGKRLELTGEVAPKNNEWAISESYNGKVTGTFQLEERNDSLMGIWYAPGADSEAEEVVLKKLVSESKERIVPEFETYQFDHKIGIYNWETEDFDKEDATDEMKLTRIGEYVIFSYDVIGSNAHIGFISGIAETINEKKAIFYGEDVCELTIIFENNSVNVEESDCSYYRGMRAYFGGTLERVK